MIFLSRHSRMSLAGIQCRVSHWIPAFAGMTAITFLLSSCVPVPPEMLPRTQQGGQPAVSSFPDVESHGVSFTSVHFTLRGYSETQLQSISSTAEDIFNQIGMDTGLSSFMANQTYGIVVYKDAGEFQSKTKLTSGTRAIAAGSSVYTYPGSDINAHLAHHLMHLIFQSYMKERASALNWLNEGLAMHQEVNRMSDAARTNFKAMQHNKLRTERMPLSQMTFYVGSNEERRHEEAWYLQVESVVDYLMRQGTGLTFAAFLNSLRNGAELDQALSNNYSGKFRNLPDLEMGWQAGT